MLEPSLKVDFLSLFYKDIENHKLEHGNSLNVFTLSIQNNQFSYLRLLDVLGNALPSFALSRSEVSNLIRDHQLNTLVKKAKSKLRKYTSNEGELGEILLYCLLESHLLAPKILSKLEIKTASNDYVKGADGVHLLQLNKSDFQLILGESKLNSDLQRGIHEAFASISKLLKDNKGKLDFEVGLVNSQLIKESYNDDIYNLLKSIIIPSASEDRINLDYSFGIFLGFEIKITDEERQLTNNEFRGAIRKRVKQTVQDLTETFNFQIRKSEFTGYSFYIYVIPFSDLVDKRKEIIKDLQD